jgi:hypothetical protein
MERRMEYDEEVEQDGQYEGGLDAVVRRGSRVSTRRQAGVPPLSAGAAKRDGLERPARRYERFEPITVRAAGRVLQLQRAGVVCAKEARFYLRELLAMDARAGRGALASLARTAQRRVAARPMARVKEGEGPGPGYPIRLEARGDAATRQLLTGLDPFSLGR